MNNDIPSAAQSPYQILPDGHIRVLCLEPGPPDARLEARLKTQPLDRVERDNDYSDHDHDEESFEAISYCWGTEISQEGLHVANGSSLRLTQSLYDALQAFRHLDQPRHLWVDAVCINQTDVHERSTQVQMMGSIYARARRVLVWLGPCRPGGSETLAFVALTAPIVARGDRPRRELLKIIYDHLESVTHCMCCHIEVLPGRRIRLGDALAAVAKLFERPWFGRLWVVQEVSLAREILVHCGKHFVPWETFTEVARVPGQVEGDEHREERAVPYAMPRAELRQIWAHCNYLNQLRARNRYHLRDKDSFKPTSLCKDLIMLSRLKCQDAHDRIYGVSRVLGLHTFDALRVDYSISVSELYRRVVELSITSLANRRGGRAVLMLALAGTESSEAVALQRPSWVPHLQYLSDRARSKHSYYQWALADREFLADAAEFRCRVVQDDPQLLQVRGRVYGQVHAVLDQSACPSKHVHRRTPSKCPDHEAMALINWHIRCCQFLESELVLPHQQEQMDDKSITQKARDIFGARHTRMRTSERHPVSQDLFVDWLAQASISIDDQGELDQLARNLSPYITGYPYDREQNLGVVSTNYGFRAAWIPPLAGPGDNVCYFAGAPYPFIIRSSSNDDFQLIGDALVLGIEEGDLLDIDSREWSVILDRARKADSDLRSWTARRTQAKQSGTAAELHDEGQQRKDEVEMAISRVKSLYRQADEHHQWISLR